MTGSGEGMSDGLDRLIGEGLRHHRAQMSLLLHLRAQGEDTAHARRLLDALGDCLDVIRGHQSRLASQTVQA